MVLCHNSMCNDQIRLVAISFPLNLKKILIYINNYIQIYEVECGISIHVYNVH